MKYSLTISAVILGIFIVLVSCKKSEEVKVERVEEVRADISGGENDLAKAMKKASLVMRRLAKAVGNNDWPEMDMWTQELKEGIGFSCVELYMIENKNIPQAFTVSSNKFNNAVNKLILCSRTHDIENANTEFNNLVKSCDACHESFNKDMKKKLDFTDTGEE